MSHSQHLARWFLKNTGKEITFRRNKDNPGLIDVVCGDESLTFYVSDLDGCWYDMLVGGMFSRK